MNIAENDRTWKIPCFINVQIKFGGDAGQLGSSNRGFESSLSALLDTHQLYFQHPDSSFG